MALHLAKNLLLLALLYLRPPNLLCNLLLYQQMYLSGLMDTSRNTWYQVASSGTSSFFVPTTSWGELYFSSVVTLISLVPLYCILDSTLSTLVTHSLPKKPSSGFCTLHSSSSLFLQVSCLCGGNAVNSAHNIVTTLNSLLLVLSCFA